MGMAAGFDEYLVKPADPTVILELLEQVRSQETASEAAGDQSP
jgi:hypothetical protein